MATDQIRCSHSEQSQRFKIIAGRKEIYVVTYCKLCQKTLSEQIDMRQGPQAPKTKEP